MGSLCEPVNFWDWHVFDCSDVFIVDFEQVNIGCFSSFRQAFVHSSILRDDLGKQLKQFGRKITNKWTFLASDIFIGKETVF